MLRIGRILISEWVNGPGKRFVIWFQGCHFRCKGCINPEFWDENGGTLMSLEELISQIMSFSHIEGVTFSGGEPFLQAKNILPLAKFIKSKGLTIVCYTGYHFHDIIQGRIPYGKELIKYIDVLIDGEYIESERAPLLWRGSRNQKVYFLTQRYKHFEPLVLMEGIEEVELQIKKDGIEITGIFDLVLWEKVKQKLISGGKQV